jgi:hypothetical protein
MRRKHLPQAQGEFDNFFFAFHHFKTFKFSLRLLCKIVLVHPSAGTPDFFIPPRRTFQITRSASHTLYSTTLAVRAALAVTPKGSNCHRPAARPTLLPTLCRRQGQGCSRSSQHAIRGFRPTSPSITFVTVLWF